MAAPEGQPRQVTIQEILQRARVPRPSVREEDWGGHKVRITSFEGRSKNPAPQLENSGLMQMGVRYPLKAEGLNT